MEDNKIPMEVEGSLWLHKAERRFLGEDRINLLEKIDECGSITKGAKAAGIRPKPSNQSASGLN